MDAKPQRIHDLHEAPDQFAIAVTGGGSLAVSDLLTAPGASRTVLTAAVPYAVEALQDFLRDWSCAAPCTEATARRMAVECFEQAYGLVEPNQPVHGLACTASLASDREKRGEHRVHVAVQSIDRTAAYSLVLAKGQRTRLEEEQIAGAMLLDAAAEAAGLAAGLAAPLLRPGESIQRSVQQAPDEWPTLGSDVAWRHGLGLDGEQETPPPKVVLPGSFNPLHEGHLAMAQVAEHRLGKPVTFELSMENVDKPPLDYLEIGRRVAQFGDRPCLVTLAPTFVDKATLMPGCVFVVGIDTLIRIADEDYYDEDPRLRDEAVDHIADSGCRFLVFGRAFDDQFVTLEDLGLPPRLAEISDNVPEDQFRVDVSSTELRDAESGG